MTDKIQEIVKALNEEHPTAEFSFGYLFNHPCPVDQQQWYVFTQVPTKDQPYSGGITRRSKYSCGGAGRMEEILADLKSGRFLRWLCDLRTRIGSPAHMRWHQKIHANDCPNCGSRSYSRGCERVSNVPNVLGDYKYREVNRCMDCKTAYPRVAA